MKKYGTHLALVALMMAAATVAGHSQQAKPAEPAATASLESGFAHPPQSARPRVWWHWMNGNITEEGIKLDLEWMHRVGLGGFQNFDAALMTPKVVDKRLAYMTPEWKHAFKYATTLADQLGMEEAIAGSPGWSESGGPWVPPAQGMKKYVWSETVVEGGAPFTGKLWPRRRARVRSKTSACAMRCPRRRGQRFRPRSMRTQSWWLTAVPRAIFRSIRCIRP